jgi:hypothetical protein
MKPRTTRLVTALAATAAIAACTTTADGSPQPAADSGHSSAQTGSTPATSTKGDAPEVASPLDAGAFVSAPCTVLTSTQLSGFDVKEPGKDLGGDGSSPPACAWGGNAQSVSIAWLTGNKGGLSDTYRRRDLDAYFIETMVDGYPGVFVASNDLRDSGECGIAVGVSDTLSFYATAVGRLDAEGSCDLAKQVAAAAIATVKAAN